MSDEELLQLKTLKTNIESNNLGDLCSKPLVFVYEDNSFLAYQYAREIAKKRNISITYLDSLEDLLVSINSCVLFDEEETLRIYACDKLELTKDISSLKDLIIICKSTTYQDVIKFPKLESWQIKSYMQTNCPGLSSKEIDWLYDITASINKNNENIYRLSNEIEKINCFPKEQQLDIFKDLNACDGYSDLSPLSIFNLTNYIYKRDYLNVAKLLEDIDSIDVEGVGLVTILHKNFKQLIDIQLGKNATPESLGMSVKQFKAIEYNCGKYSQQELIRIFKFLTSVDYKLKSGMLELSKDRLIDYIVCNVLS